MQSALVIPYLTFPSTLQPQLRVPTSLPEEQHQGGMAWSGTKGMKMGMPGHSFLLYDLQLWASYFSLRLSFFLCNHAIKILNLSSSEYL